MYEKNLNLDILRIFSAFMVLSVHIGQYAGIDFSVGAKGVQLFFIMSGYLAFLSLDKDPSPIHYYRKRIIRIVPAYWFCLILICIEDILLGGELQIGKSWGNLVKFLRYFFFAQCFLPSDNWDLWNNYSALWTMSAFAGFYIIAPFLYRCMKKFYRAFLFLFVFIMGTEYIAITIQNILSIYPSEAHIERFATMNPLTELYCFLLGCTLFISIKENKQFLYAMILVITMIVKSFTWYAYEMLFTLWILLSVSFKPIFRKEIVCRIIVLSSKGSFMLYLVHPIILRIAPILREQLCIKNKFIYAIFLYISCIGVSYVLYYLIIQRSERKLIKLGGLSV